MALEEKNDSLPFPRSGSMKRTTFSLLGLTCDLLAERAFFARGLRKSGRVANHKNLIKAYNKGYEKVANF